MISNTHKEYQEQILQILTGRFPGLAADAVSLDEMLTLSIPASSVHETIQLLKEDPLLNFSFLTTLCGIHYPDQALPFGVVYHLHNLEHNYRIRIKTWLPKEKPEIATLTDLFQAANWMERETYDFYGIVFTGHPNLIRILNVEYLDYFPMRKEYPLEDPTREDKEDKFFGR
jgi:NADH-quinone oxidoreductase subunit C